MKATLLLTLFLTFPLWGKPVVVIGHFDAYGNAPFNNSTVVAQRLFQETLLRDDFEVRLCPLNTVFDKSFYQLEDCITSLPEAPKLVLGLGEAFCDFKVETMARNFDRTFGPDNEGNERFSIPILTDGKPVIGLSYPLARMYCSRPKTERSQIGVSNDAGSFVCNNLAYQVSAKYESLPFGFIHVPSNNCKNLMDKTNSAIGHLKAMITEAVKVESSERLKTTRSELREQRRKHRRDECLEEFYRRSKGIDG